VFSVSGWGSGAFRWRLDGGPWTNSSVSQVAPGAVQRSVTHVFEAQSLSVPILAPAQDTVIWTASTDSGNILRLPGLVDGSHTLLAVAVDAASNVDPTGTNVTWLVDTQPPRRCAAAVTTSDAIPVSVEGRGVQ
jgi:hypothetical protein